MPLEIEVKLRVDSHEPVRQRLQSLGATRVGDFREDNAILDRPDKSLFRSGSGLRLRKSTNHDTSESKSVVTFKGPPQSGTFKTREEVEVRVDHHDAALELLGRLGFQTILRYEKLREKWKLAGCLIELDTPAKIGLFVEIEGPNDNAIQAARSALQLDSARIVPESYVAMLMQYCDEHAIKDRTLTLDDLPTN